MQITQQQRLRRRGICIVIPTYNNAGTIVDVVTRAMLQCDDVFVVCDGCTDNTVELLQAMHQVPRLVVLPCNSGKGTALKKGFQAALEAGFAYAITLDGDGQHFPEDVPALLQANIAHPGALIVGQRKNLENMERSRGSRFANRFSNFWFALQTCQYLEDTQTGYRLYPLKKLSGLGLVTSRYEAELELMVFARWNGVKLVSVPVNVFYPSREERVSHFRPGRDFTRISVLNTMLCLLALVYGYPRMILRGMCTCLRTFYALILYMSAVLFSLNLRSFFVMHGKASAEDKRRRIHKILWKLSHFITVTHGIPGSRYSMDNPHGEDLSKPCVIICNHQSPLDLMPLLSFSPKIVVLTADWVWKSPYFGYAIRKAGYMQASAGIETLLPQIRQNLSEGYSIAIYPEGTRSVDGRIGRFHQGAFLVAREMGLDILPLTLYGSGKVLPKHGRIFNRWPMHMEVGERISPCDMALMADTTKGQASVMRGIYNENYSRIADKMEQNI